MIFCCLLRSLLSRQFHRRSAVYAHLVLLRYLRRFKGQNSTLRPDVRHAYSSPSPLRTIEASVNDVLHACAKRAGRSPSISLIYSAQPLSHTGTSERAPRAYLLHDPHVCAASRRQIVCVWESRSRVERAARNKHREHGECVVERVRVRGGGKDAPGAHRDRRALEYHSAGSAGYIIFRLESLPLVGASPAFSSSPGFPHAQQATSANSLYPPRGRR